MKTFLLLKRKVFWYTVKDPETSPPLSRNISADAVVIGGGMTGLTCAQTLKRNGLDVVLVEKDFCGAGASGKSSGFITPDSELEISQLIRRFGKKKAKTPWEFAISGVNIIRRNIEKFNIACDYQLQDSLFISNTKSGFDNVREEYEARKTLGYQSTLYTQAKVPQIIGSQGYYGAVRYPDTFGINSYIYCQKMKKVLKGKGVKIYEHTPVKAINPEKVETRTATIKGKFIIVCLDRFIPDLGKLIKSVYHAQTFLMVSFPLEKSQVRALFPQGPLMVWDTDLIYQYYRLIGGNRLLLGGGSVLHTYAKEERQNVSGIFAKLSGYIEKKFPQANIRWQYLWPGLIGITKDLLPIVDCDQSMPNVYYVGAGAGLPWSAAAGDYIAHVVTHGQDGHDEYKKFLGAKRKFFVGDSLHAIIGTKGAFALSNLWSKYYQKESKN